MPLPQAAMHHDAVRIPAPRVVRGELGGDVGMAALSPAGGGMEPVVRVVDAMRDQLLADVLAHVAVVPAALAGIEFLEEHAGGQHHFGKREGGVWGHDEPADRHGLEILPVRFGFAGKFKLAAGRRQHAHVNRVDEQLRRRAHLQPGESALEVALAKLEREAGRNPLRRQDAAPGVAGIGEGVVVQLALANPSAVPAFDGGFAPGRAAPDARHDEWWIGSPPAIWCGPSFRPAPRPRADRCHEPNARRPS